MSLRRLIVPKVNSQSKSKPNYQQLHQSSPSSSPPTPSSEIGIEVYLVKNRGISLDFMKMVGRSRKDFLFAPTFSLFGMIRPPQKTELSVNLEPAKLSEESRQLCMNIGRKTIGLGGAAFVQRDQFKNISVSFKVKSFSESTENAIITIQISGPFITRLQKEYRKPLKMGVLAVFNNIIIDRVVCNDLKFECKDMILTNLKDENESYRYEKDVEAPWFGLLVSRASQLTQKPDPALRSKGPSPSASEIEGEISIKLIGDPESILGWVSPYDNESLCRKFLEDRMFTDFILISEDNQELPCHKLFLEGHSPVFAAMFKMENERTNENKSCKLAASKESVEALLKFLYCSDLDFPLENSGVALELLNIGHQYLIATLENSMTEILMRKPVEWFDKEVALLLFIRARKLEEDYDYASLKEKAVEVIKAKGTELNSSSVMDKILKEDPVSAKELLVLLSTTATT
ncbi:unnamed protein product [Orchesella dallaii]|uniref:BTB domain-containing protein n=1 Tax=Orchesella dallaii TaxID=48710 RepID=A0ABP1QM75_9HEXA